MKLHTFFEEVNNHIEYLAYGSLPFEGYLKISIKNRRVRNCFVFFVLSTEKNAELFFKLALNSLYVADLKKQLHKALIRVTNNKLYRVEIVNIAEELLLKYFYNETITVDYSVYDISAEMEKFLAGVVNHYCNKEEVTDEKRKYRETLLKDVDWENLFVPYQQKKRSD